MEFSAGDITWLVFRFANPNHGAVEYDKKGQLLAVKDSDGNAVERYAYDKAWNMVKKVVRVRSAECGVLGKTRSRPSRSTARTSSSRPRPTASSRATNTTPRVDCLSVPS